MLDEASSQIRAIDFNMNRNYAGELFKIWAHDNQVYGPIDLPVLIQWLNGPHPATSLPDAGCFLTGLDVTAEPLSRLVLDSRCSAGPELIASIRTPHGLRSLRKTGDA